MAQPPVAVSSSKGRSHHHALVPRSADDAGKHSSRRIIACEPRLHHARPIVAYERTNFAVVGLWEQGRA